MSYRAIRCCFGDVFSNVQWGWVEFDKEFCKISCCWGDVFLIFVFHNKNRLQFLHQISPITLVSDLRYLINFYLFLEFFPYSFHFLGLNPYTFEQTCCGFSSDLTTCREKESVLQVENNQFINLTEASRHSGCELVNASEYFPDHKLVQCKVKSQNLNNETF